jgi:hypothetical protein
MQVCKGRSIFRLEFEKATGVPRIILSANCLRDSFPSLDIFKKESFEN